MRVKLALTLYVSLCTRVFASAAETDIRGALLPHPTWQSVHERGNAAYSRKAYREAEALFRTSWELSADPVQRAISANDTGDALHYQGRERDARTWMETALTIWESLPANQDAAAHTSVGLADVLRGLGEYETAARIHRKALAFQGLHNDTRAKLLNSYADLLREEGQFERAMALFEQAAKLPCISERRAIDSLIGRGELARHFGSFERSLDQLREAATRAENQNLPLLQSIALRDLAQTYLDAGSAARAEPLLKRALGIMDAEQAPSQQVAMTLSCMGELYREQGKLTLAEGAWSKTLAMEEAVLGASHPQVAIILEQLAELLSLEKRMDLAEEYANRSYRIMKDSMGEASPAAGAALAALALVETRGHLLHEAAVHYEKSLAAFHASGLDYQATVAAILERYGAVLKSLHRGREANLLALQAKAMRFSTIRK